MGFISASFHNLCCAVFLEQIDLNNKILYTEHSDVPWSFSKPGFHMYSWSLFFNLLLFFFSAM